MITAFYDPVTFKRIKTVPKYKKASWVKRFYEVGSFELDIQEMDIPNNSILLHDGNAGIVMETQEGLSGGLSVCGYDLKGLAEFRYIEDPIAYENKTAEYIIKDLAVLYLMTGERTITGLEVEADSGEGDIIESYTVEAGFLSEQLEKISKSYKIGYDIIFDEQKMVFKTEYSRENINVTFSKRYHNLEDATYTKSNYNTYNVVYSKDEEENTVSLGTANGIFRREGYTSKSAEMESFLVEKKEIENIEGTASGKAVYGLDYKLGDNVKVIFKRLETKKIISEVNILYEKGTPKIYPVFGTEKQNPIKKILRG